MISTALTRQLVLAISCAVFSNAALAADQIELPDEELAKESVLPVFDTKRVVRNRKIITEKRLEVGGGIGLNLIEALYESMTFNLTSTYHFDETNAMNFDFIKTSTDLSSMGKDLKNGKGIQIPFDPSRAPSPEYLLFGNYQFTAYYGKVSVSKSSVMNLSLYGLLGAGLVSWGDSTQPALNVGFGQKFYFNKNFAFRADLNMAAYRGPDPTDPKDGDMVTGGGKKKSDDFETIYYFRSFLRGALVYLF